MAIDPQLIFNSTIQALILSVISNLLAQFFSCYRDAVCQLFNCSIESDRS